MRCCCGRKRVCYSHADKLGLEARAYCPSLHSLPGPGGHHSTAALGAELCDGAIQHVDLVEEVYS